METVFLTFFSALGATIYKVIIYPNFCARIPDWLVFVIFAIVWASVLYVFIFCKESLTKRLYMNLKNSFYGNDSKEKEFCILVFAFCLIIAVSCYIYYSIEKDISFADWIGFISSVITILGIPTLFSGFFIKNETGKTEVDGNNSVSYSSDKRIILSDSDSYNVGAQIGFMQRNQSKDVDITEKNSEGYKVILRDIPVFGEKNKFELDSENKVLYVSNYLNRMSGENLWREMNRWYRSSNNVGRYYPLINAQENNWHGNKEWNEQLSSFIKYLQKTNQLFSEDDN